MAPIAFTGYAWLSHLVPGSQPGSMYAERSKGSRDLLVSGVWLAARARALLSLFRSLSLSPLSLSPLTRAPLSLSLALPACPPRGGCAGSYMKSVLN